ncbi:hypothetical protein FQA39_LY04514 [Lamprigera yunnana]|nr:hypothetical protein FQA39_LY04514 [Lamprigera yunnana]
MGDMNGRGVNDNESIQICMGTHGEPIKNNNGKWPIDLCVTNDLILKNTIFKQKDTQKSIIDFTVSREYRRVVKAVKVQKQADIGSDLEAFEYEYAALGDFSQDLDRIEESEAEELFGENMEADYRSELDRYDIGNLEDYDDVSPTARLAAEEELRQTDRERGVYRKADGELFYDRVFEKQSFAFNAKNT